MRKLALLFGIVLAIGFMGGMASAAQETALTVGARSGPRMEIGKTLFTFQDVLGHKKLDVDIWAGAGSTVDGTGKLVGSFAALAQAPGFAKGLRASVGVALVGTADQRSQWDLAAHFQLDSSQAASVSFHRHRMGVVFQRRY